MSEYQAPYYPEPCNLPGHVPGCAGRAGGEHEVQLQPLPLDDDTRLEIGKLIFDRFLDTLQGTRLPEATVWLEAIGFGRVEWIQGDQDEILLLLLWRFNPDPDDQGPNRILDEFIIEFSGYDAANISLFNLVKEVSL